MGKRKNKIKINRHICLICIKQIIHIYSYETNRLHYYYNRHVPCRILIVFRAICTDAYVHFLFLLQNIKLRVAISTLKILMSLLIARFGACRTVHIII